MSVQVKTRSFAGAVCIQTVYQMPEGARITKAPKREPRPRFKSDEEREEHKRRISRDHCAMLINANFSPSSYFHTLTFNNESEIYDFEDARTIRDKYWEKVRYRYPDAKMMLFMGRGKSTARIHFHMITEGVPPEVIRKLWIWGTVIRSSPLREHNKDSVTGKDHGRDYWTPEQGKGRRYKCTKNLQQPEREKPTVCARHYDAEHPPIPPKGYLYTGDCYITTYGYMRFRYIVDPHMRK